MNRQEARRTIAVTVWGQRVSPVFDAAGTMLIAEIEGNVLINSTSLAFDPQRPRELLRLLQERRVSCLIARDLRFSRKKGRASSSAIRAIVLESVLKSGATP